MIGALILLAAQAAPVAEASAPPPAEADPIVVIGRRLQAITVSVGQGPDGKWYCGMEETTGRLALDEKLCKAVTKCVRKGALDDASIHACVSGTKKRLMRELERERASR